MKPRQQEVLQNSKLPGNRLYTDPLEWMMIRSTQAMDERYGNQGDAAEANGGNSREATGNFRQDQWPNAIGVRQLCAEKYPQEHRCQRH